MRASFVCLTFFVLWMMGCAVDAAPSSTARPTRAPLSASLAVRAGLESLRADSPMGHLVGKPSLLRGQVMSHAQAKTILDGPNAGPPKRSPERLVWLIVTRARWLLHIPGSQGDPAHGAPPVRPHDIFIDNLYAGVILDAITGDTLERGGMNPQQEAVINELPPFSENND
jgi:hypothetical protein